MRLFNFGYSRRCLIFSLLVFLIFSLALPSSGGVAARRRAVKAPPIRQAPFGKVQGRQGKRKTERPKPKIPTRAERLEQARRLIATLMLPAATIAPPLVVLSPPPVADPAIDLRTVVALRCYERDSIGAVLLRRKGTGVLISRFGHILTSRHLVDPEWLARTTGQSNDSTFDHCDVSIPESSRAPTFVQIRTINPQLASGFFLFASHRVFVPAETNLSPDENKLLDFALLKIDGLTPAAQIISKLPDYSPDHFPFTGLTEVLPPEQTEVVTFGYPAEPGLNVGSRFGEFYLKGSIEQLLSYGRGDQYFDQMPLVAELRAESGIFGGRSGSPIFYRGEVFALIFGTDPELLSKNYAVTSTAILQTLREQGQAAELGY